MKRITEMLVNGIKVTVEDIKVACEDGELKQDIVMRCVRPQGAPSCDDEHAALVDNIVANFDGKIVSGDQFGLTPPPPDSVF